MKPLGETSAGAEQRSPTRTTLNKEAVVPGKFPLAGHELLPPALPADANLVEAPVFHFAGIGFARIGYP